MNDGTHGEHTKVRRTTATRESMRAANDRISHYYISLTYFLNEYPNIQCMLPPRKVPLPNMKSCFVSFSRRLSQRVCFICGLFGSSSSLHCEEESNQFNNIWPLAT